MTRAITTILIVIFTTSMFIVPAALVRVNNNIALQSAATLAQIPRDARVAIYDEANLTAPAISAAVNLTNNLAEITTLLENVGHSVELLTEADILNHELMTADYDVFILVNNVPRPSISKMVKEFWMGGGGLLSFNGAMSYLWYEGILEPLLDYDPYFAFWIYDPSDTQNVSARHPTMKEYHINDTVTERTGHWAITSTSGLNTLDDHCDFTVLLSTLGSPSYVTGFAIDYSDYGGRIVHLPGDGSSIPTDFESVIIDSVEYLVPRPKGRIVYDFTHSPRLAVDEWDDLATVYHPDNSFTQLRTLLTNHSYTFDKLYPLSSGNLTAERLAKYDVLIIVWPDSNYTDAEYLAVESWVSEGGSLLVLGDRTGLSGGGPGNTYINMMLRNFDMSLGTTDALDFSSMTPGVHLTLEGCVSLYIGYRNYLSVIGTASSIWYDGPNTVVAGQSFGQGRAILSADMNIFDNAELPEESNRRFALNVMDWLTAAEAETLVFTSYGGHFSDVVTAMRDLGHPYQMVVTNDYLDDFLDSRSWELVIVDQANLGFANNHLDELYAYVDGGGKLIMSYYNIDDAQTHPLWSKLGVEYSTDLSGDPSMYIWDATHPVFNQPNDRNGANFSSNVFFGDDGDSLTVLSGFTAIAGRTALELDGAALIVLGNDKRTLYNGYLIDTCTGDEDDSTYRDSVELWQNEIVFMMAASDGLPFTLDPMTLLIIGGAALAVIVTAVVVSRRKSGGPKPKPRKKSTKKK